MRRKILKYKELFILSILALLLIATLSFLYADSCVNIAAASTTEFEIIDGTYDSYTDSDFWLYKTDNNGITVPRKYQEEMYCSTITHSFDNLDRHNVAITGDDPIIRIIPKELFSINGNHTYIGKEYGFFIKTEQEKYREEPTVNKKSTVLVFDIKADFDFKKTIDNIVLSVTPIFQYDYVYLSPQAEFYTLKDSVYDDYVIPVLCSVDDYTVIPAGRGTNLIFITTSRPDII